MDYFDYIDSLISEDREPRDPEYSSLVDEIVDAELAGEYVDD